MHTIGTLNAQSITDDRIRHAATRAVARDTQRASATTRRKPHLSLRRVVRQRAVTAR